MRSTGVSRLRLRFTFGEATWPFGSEGESFLDISMPEAARTSFALSLPWAMELAVALLGEAEGVEAGPAGAVTAGAPLGESVMTMTVTYQLSMDMDGGNDRVSNGARTFS